MNGQPNGTTPILCAHLLRTVDEKLVDLLGSLAPSEWDLQTVAPSWKVRDVAAHLLDTVLRKLAMVRDSCYVEAVTIRSPHDVVALVNRLNAEGVTVYRRLSPPLLINLMRTACEHTARELTERWHHQQQIRLATNRPGIMTPDLYHPVLDCFVRGLPYVYRDVDTPVGTALLLEISGECGGQWFLSRGATQWNFGDRPDGAVASRVTIPQDLAWRVFTKGIDRDSARRQIAVEGNRDLGEKVIDLIAIVA